MSTLDSTAVAVLDDQQGLAELPDFIACGMVALHCLGWHGLAERNVCAWQIRFAARGY